MKRIVAAVAAAAALGGAAQAQAQREIGPATQERPHAIPGGFDLPNGWRITPAGEKLAETGDLVMRLSAAPDGKAVIAVNAGYLPHGLTVIDPATGEAVQKIPLKSAWLGLAWSPDGKQLYVAGGNAAGPRQPTAAPVYVFDYRGGRLSEQPTGRFDETIPMEQIWWSGLARHPTKPRLYAANQGVDETPTNVVVFDTDTGRIVTRIPVEISPYQLVLSKDGSRLFVSNWSSRSISVIDTAQNKVVASIAVGANPNDMALATDGRLFVACASDNTIHVIDTKQMRVVERLSSAMSPLAPAGSTPNALAIDAKRGVLFAANADNNALAVVDIRNRARSEVMGFVPTGWYPSALSVTGGQLYIGASKGEAAYPDPQGPHSPLNPKGGVSIKTLQTGSVSRLAIEGVPKALPGWTRQAAANSPYNDALLAQARPAKTPSIVPSVVGAGSPIQHVIYIIRENRTYDQVLGDLGKGDGDPRLAIFGREVTPNAHALAEQFVLLDNFYADGEVSVDGHSWSNAAYATDFNEKWWPPTYGDTSESKRTPAIIPASGYLWDQARKKGLTYRSYGELGARVSTGEGQGMEAAAGVDGLVGHMSRKYRAVDARDTELAQVFLEEFDAYEGAFDSPNPAKRLPNYIVMALPEDHTEGTRAGAFTPVAHVANNDLALGRIVERVSHSKYWPQTAIIIVEDDAQDGPDHVDARRTVALVASPYIKRASVDHTLYTTVSMLRTIELLLGLPPMTQYDAAATPLYASFGTSADLTPYSAQPARVDVNAKNLATAWGAAASARMDFDDVDRAPMQLLNEIIWKSVKGVDSPMPPPVHRYRGLVDVAAGE